MPIYIYQEHTRHLKPRKRKLTPNQQAYTGIVTPSGYPVIAAVRGQFDPPQNKCRWKTREQVIARIRELAAQPPIRSAPTAFALSYKPIICVQCEILICGHPVREKRKAA